MARQADGVIMILRSAHTTRDAALLAKQRFLDDGIPVMGAILNNWNPKRRDSATTAITTRITHQYSTAMAAARRAEGEAQPGGKKRCRGAEERR